MLWHKTQGAGFGAAVSTAIEDVFSTYLYTGTAATQTITNGIDLAGEGGLVWFKRRISSNPHQLFDTVRTSGYSLTTNNTDAQDDKTWLGFSVSSTGFSFGTADADFNASGATYASWTFRKASRFFDVVTYTGDGTVREIPHNLGCDVGTIIVKCTSNAEAWVVWHKDGNGAGSPSVGQLESTAAFNTGNYPYWFGDGSVGIPPTSSVFTVYSGNAVNRLGRTYVAYLFAHDPLGPSGDGSDGLIACGSFVPPASGEQEVVIGWEPQWVLTFDTTGGDNWRTFDNMRGWSQTERMQLSPNNSAAEFSLSNTSGYENKPTARGFIHEGHAPGDTHIYIAIRRGPMREPTSGTEVFAMDTFGGTAPTPPSGVSNFPVDMAWYKLLNGIESHWNSARLTGSFALQFNSNSAQSGPDANYAFDYNNGYGGWTSTNTNYQHWMFRRAPGFFDVVAYTGNGGGYIRNILLSANSYVCTSTYPCEMLISKSRSTGTWYVWHKDVQAGSPNYYLSLNSTSGATLQSGIFGSFGPSITSEFNYFETSNNDDRNAAGVSYINYLFATLPGVSKVGSYTGNGSSQTINCGFTGGARLVLIKRTDSTGDWYVWDTARGIVAGNDPHLSLNTTAAEVTSDDSIDPDSSGFIVNQLAATNINVSSASYIYLAIS